MDLFTFYWLSWTIEVGRGWCFVCKVNNLLCARSSAGLPAFIYYWKKKKKTPTPKPYTALLGLHGYSWLTPLRNVYTIKPRFCFHIAEFVMCRQPHQKSGCKQPRSSSCTPPLQKALGASRRGLRSRGDRQGRVTRDTLCSSSSLLIAKHQGRVSVSDTWMKGRVRWLFFYPPSPTSAFWKSVTKAIKYVVPFKNSIPLKGNNCIECAFSWTPVLFQVLAWIYS